MLACACCKTGACEIGAGKAGLGGLTAAFDVALGTLVGAAQALIEKLATKTKGSKRVNMREDYH